MVLGEDALKAYASGAPINWARLGQAVSFYEAEGFKYQEVPWVIEPEVSEITFKGVRTTLGAGPDIIGDLVGSAEQGFLQMLKNGTLPPGRYCSLTPCFRLEDEFKAGHRQLHFAKVELFSTNQEDNLIDVAIKFFMSQKAEVLIEDTEQGQDVLLNGIEIGSYYNRWGYACGTGLAEPRFTATLETSSLVKMQK